MSWIYMNHFIRDPKNKEPVVTVQKGRKRVYADKVEILDIEGEVVAIIQLGAVPHAHHEVKVAVEVNDARASYRFIDLL